MAQKNKETDPSTIIIPVVVVAIITMFVFLKHPMLIMLGLLALGVLVGSIYMIIANIRKNKREAAYAETNEGRVQEYLNECTAQIKQNQEEVTKIKKDISELRTTLNSKFEIAPEKKLETEKLIAAFENEVKLRDAKIEFYKTCSEKLNTLLYNHKLSIQLAEKKEALDRLKEQHFEDIAPMETLASDIEHDKMYLESIEDLKFRIASSKSADSALEIRSELIQMTKELRKL